MKADNHLELEQRIQSLLADPGYQGHPLAIALEDVWDLFKHHVERLERITVLSDSFQAMARERERGLNQRFERQLRRLNRIVEISDRYQNMLRDINTHLEEASNRDMLTGVYNRRALMQMLEQASLASARDDTPFMLALIDVDRFKQINDVFGHQTGDLALVEIAHLLSADLEPGEECGRWGGEEFLLIMPERSAAEAHALLTHKLAQVRGMHLKADHLSLSGLTISAGLSRHLPGEAFTHTLNRADAALYAAKRQGRDCIAPTLDELV